MGRSDSLSGAMGDAAAVKLGGLVPQNSAAKLETCSLLTVSFNVNIGSLCCYFPLTTLSLVSVGDSSSIRSQLLSH